MEAQALRSFVADATATTVCSKAELQQCRAIAIAVDKLLRREADAELRADFVAALFVYQCDGWASWISDVVRVEGVDRIVGRRRREFLLEHAFLRIRPPAGPDKVCQCSSPARVLDQGKTAWHQFSASSEFHKLIAQDNSEKICISMYVMDGANFTACKRFFRARHFSAFQPGGECNREGTVADRVASLFDWNLYLRCKSHQTQLSVKWCLDPHKHDDTAKAAHNSVRSLKSNAADLQSKVPEFAMQCVRFTDRDCSPVDLRTFWQLLGIPDELLEIFILVDPCWHNGALEVSSAVAHRSVLRFVA